MKLTSLMLAVILAFYCVSAGQQTFEVTNGTDSLEIRASYDTSSDSSLILFFFDTERANIPLGTDLGIVWAHIDPESGIAVGGSVPAFGLELSWKDSNGCSQNSASGTDSVWYMELHHGTVGYDGTIYTLSATSNILAYSYGDEFITFDGTVTSFSLAGSLSTDVDSAFDPLPTEDLVCWYTIANGNVIVSDIWDLDASMTRFIDALPEIVETDNGTEIGGESSSASMPAALVALGLFIQNFL